MKNKNIKKQIVFILMISFIFSNKVFSATIYNDIKKIGPGIDFDNQTKQQNFYSETPLKYIKNIIKNEYTIKYDDIFDNKKFANITILLPELNLETEEKTIIANYLLQTTGLEILKEYTKNYVIDFNQNRASMRCHKTLKQTEYVYIFSFMCNSIHLCDIVIDFSTNQCYSK